MFNAKNIIDSLKNQDIKVDKAQIKLIDKLIKISHDESCFILNLLSKKKNKGIYIWSDVGRGKTVVVKEFLKNTNHKNVKCFHYISFINFIHDQLNKNSGLKDPFSIAIPPSFDIGLSGKLMTSWFFGIFTFSRLSPTVFPVTVIQSGSIKLFSRRILETTGTPPISFKLTM